MKKSSCKHKHRIDQIDKKIESVGRHKLLRCEQSYARYRLRDQLDYQAQYYAKEKVYKGDRKKRVKCLSCNREITFDEANGSHWIDKGSSGGGNYRCRREERNIHNCCENCNAWNKEQHHNMLTLHMVKTYGQERVDDKLNEVYKLHDHPDYRDMKDTLEAIKLKISQI